jgi:nucleoside-specific outer membrane channel protein Tsx
MISFAISSPLHADVIDYHTTNIQLLKGWDYKLGEENRTLITLEHFNRWTYGDFFMFIDGTRYEGGNTAVYGEFSPRFSLSKISGHDFSVGAVQDVFISTMLEHGTEGRKTYLYGAAVNFDLPGFQVLTANLYRRDNPDISGATWQTTLAWKRPLTISDTQFLFEGFADFAGNEGSTYKTNQLIVPRFLIDVGMLADRKKGNVYAGIEWQYWHNKAGISGTTESVPQLQLKWVFD